MEAIKKKKSEIKFSGNFDKNLKLRAIWKNFYELLGKF